MSNSKGSEELLNPGTVVASREQAENILLKRAVRRMTAILVLLGLAFCFFASSICITVIFAGFLAILVEPWVKALEKIRIPRVIGAALVILLGAAAIGTFSYASYGKLRDFSDDFPRYVTRIADAVSPISSKIRRVQDSAGALAQEAAPKKVPEVRIRESTSWAEYLVRGMGSVWGSGHHCGGGSLPHVFHPPGARQNVFVA